ncbi:MAG: MBL fold metallo-hydrolase, partial [Erysipelotrichaceae bacterium]|nr:MBL fold metallo-hydrolase [Erysipelotrichaceae bacterium]
MKSWRTPNPHKLIRGAEIVSIEPLRIFDNLSFMTNTFVGCFLLETSEGLMLLDSMYARDHDYQVESIRKLGYDPKDIKKILITHGHGDHFDGAARMKELTGATVYMSKIDEAFAQDMANVKPGRQPMPDIVDEYLEDHGEVTLGDTTVKTYHTPGHTPGCMSFILPVYDEGRRHTASLWGGTGLAKERKDNETLLQS